MAHGGFVQVHDRVAIGFLVASVDQRVKRKRIIIRSGDFFFQQRPEYPGFHFIQYDIHNTSNHIGDRYPGDRYLGYLATGETFSHSWILYRAQDCWPTYWSSN